ncbi:MAG: hypothetical protein AB7P40_07715 [Chloroflexota bacterium]
MSDTMPPTEPWKPRIGDRVILVRTGQTATVLRLAPTEWGLLCDLEFDAAPGAEQADQAPKRRVHASTELALLVD